MPTGGRGDLTFTGGPVTVPPRTLTAIPLAAAGDQAAVAVEDGELVFTGPLVQRELILHVRWPGGMTGGHRFAHTRCDDGAPLHSEAIEARVLDGLTGGTQVLRGTTWTGPGGVSRVAVEVWHDASTELQVEAVSVTVREPN